jgi:hypothetical protein
MADGSKRPADHDGGMQLVKRQRTQESALVVGSITKDVSEACLEPEQCLPLMLLQM